MIKAYYTWFWLLNNGEATMSSNNIYRSNSYSCLFLWFSLRWWSYNLLKPWKGNVKWLLMWWCTHIWIVQAETDSEFRIRFKFLDIFTCLCNFYKKLSRSMNLLQICLPVIVISTQMKFLCTSKAWTQVKIESTF